MSSLANGISKAGYRLLSREKYYFRDDDWSIGEADALVHAARSFAPDIVVAHFITGFIDFETLARIHRATTAPVIFYLMDMAPLTGGCHFAWDCRRYESGCGACPALRFGGDNDKSARVVTNKQAALTSLPHMVVSGASSLSSQARRSRIFGNSTIRTIPMAIDHELFRPRDPGPLRREFGLHRSRPVVFFASRRREQLRKGIPTLKEALKILANRMSRPQLPQLLVAGDGPDFAKFQSKGYAVKSLGSVGLDVLARCYAAADTFVSPSLEDSGPMMINESVMSGTPVVAFDIGVARDFIQEGKTGILVADVGSPSALANAISSVTSWPEEKQAHASMKLRSVAERLLTRSAQSIAFAALAKDLIESPSSALSRIEIDRRENSHCLFEQR